MTLEGRVILITGATAGIGNATAERLVGLGMKVVGCARNYERLVKFADEMNKKGPGEMLAIKCDVEKENEIIKMFDEIKKKYGTLHALINNAGFALNVPMLSGSTEGWRSMLNVNVLAPAICTRETYKIMKDAGVDDGNIIFMNSLSGHRIVDMPYLNFYSVTKYAVTAMAGVLKKELHSTKTNIRATSISPGVVKTEFIARGTNEEVAEAAYKQMKPLLPEDVVDAVVFVLNSKPRNNIEEITFSPVSMKE